MTAMSFLGDENADRYKKIEKNEKNLNGCGIYGVGRHEVAEHRQVGRLSPATTGSDFLSLGARNLK